MSCYGSDTMIETESLEHRITQKLKTLSVVAWDGKCDDRLVTDWLRQFNGESGVTKDGERLQMLYLLSNFLYFGSREIQELLRSIYRDLFKYRIVESIRLSHSNTTDAAVIEPLYSKALGATRFLGLGGPSASATHLLYDFRQQNRLPNKLFISPPEIFSNQPPNGLRDHSVRRYVFIDDFAGSGNQALQHATDIVTRIRTIDVDIRVYYFLLFSTTRALKTIGESGLFNEVDTVFELGDDFRAFSANSLFYSVPAPDISQSDTMIVANHYGRGLLPSHPLGYENGQLLVGFAHNVPNNTLPIFWHSAVADRPWTAPFPRHPRVSLPLP